MKQNILFCSRDRFGIKPFYYYLDEDSFVFGSEIKSILRFPIKNISVNENQIIRSIAQGYRFVDGGRDTFYKEIKQLLPAEYLILDMNKNNFKFKRYWEVDFEKKVDLKDEKKIIAKFRNLLIDAVKIRLRSDVPFAFTLSGGLDSSSIISITKKILKKDTIAFSAIYSKGNKYDEQDYIEPTIKDLSIKYHFIKVDLGNFFENLKKMIKFNDEPICTVTFYSQWQVMKKIKEKGFKVVLSGFAADEITSGYYDHYLYYFYDLYKEKKYDLLKDELDMWKKNHDKSLDDWHRFKKNLDNSEFLSPKKEIYIKLFKKGILKKFVEKRQSNYTSSMLKNRMYNELRKESVPVALRPEDRHSMMFSIESRVPFLDYRLVEFCFSIPDSLKIKNGLAKYILRESMKDIVNKKVRTRKEKVGFNAPMYEWIKNELREDIEKLLHDEDLNIYQFIDKDMLLELWNEHINEKNNHMMLFWNVLNIEFWLRYFYKIKNNGIIGSNVLSH